MGSFTRSRQKIDINEIVQNNRGYFANPFLLSLKKSADISFLLEMDEIYLLDRPFFEKYAFVGLFRMNIHNWHKSGIPITQLGLYNSYRNSIMSHPAYYHGKLKDEIRMIYDAKNTKVVENFFDLDYNPISEDEYNERKDLDRMVFKTSDINPDEIENLTTQNPESKFLNSNPTLSNLDLLRAFQLMLESGESLDNIRDSVTKSINEIDNKIDLFREEENNGYSIEKQWSVKLYGTEKDGMYYVKWFKSRNEGIVFLKKLLRDHSMSIVQSEMICILP